MARLKLEQIAKLAGVSRTTASYVINGKSKQYRISEATQQKVMAVVEQHDYQPNLAAATLRAGQSRSLGLVVPDLENASYARLAKLLERDARAQGFQLIISCSDDEVEAEKAVVNNLLHRHIDALLVATVLPTEDLFYQKIQAKGTPVIGIDREMDNQHFATVLSENFEGARELAESLCKDSPKTIGLIGAMPELSVSHIREQGVRAALAHHGIELQSCYGDHFSAQQGFQLTQHWLDQDCFPPALLLTSYSLFEGAMDCLLSQPQPVRDRLLRETRIATFGDNRLLDLLPTRINSLGQKYELIADKALHLALSALKGNYQTGPVLLPRELKTR